MAAINIVSLLVAMTGPTGMIFSVGISFIGGIISLFGKSPGNEKPVSEIVREQIDEALATFYDQQLSDKAEGAITALSHSKAFLDGVINSGQKLTKDEITALSSLVPVYYGVEFMGELAAKIRKLTEANEVKNAKKTLKYIELYCTMAAIKVMTLQLFASVLPDSFRSIRSGVLAQLNTMNVVQTNLLKFLFEPDFDSKIMPFFDPEVSVTTDAYLRKVLKLPDYDRSLAGTYCLTPKRQEIQPGATLAWTPPNSHLPKSSNPYATVSHGSENCFWKVIPHARSLYSIINTKGCPDGRYCGAMLAVEPYGNGKARATIDHNPALWKLAGKRRSKRY